MRVLILSAFLAVAAAAPNGLYGPALVPVFKTVGVPAAIPTISPGDIQAAAIDAQVQAQDQLQAAADKARQVSEQAIENINEKVVTDATGANEQNLEAFWSAENQKWQAIDALKTAEAQIDGAVASNANLIAKSAVRGVIPFKYINGVGAISPIVAPIPPVVYSSYIAPSSYSTQTLISGQEIKTEIKEDNTEAAVKAAEPALGVEPVQAAEPVQVAEPASAEKSAEKAEQSAAVKAAANLNEKPAFIAQPLFSGAQLGIPDLYRYDVPAVGHLIGQPILKYATGIQQVHGVLTPTFVKAW